MKKVLYFLCIPLLVFIISCTQEPSVSSPEPTPAPKPVDPPEPEPEPIPHNIEFRLNNGSWEEGYEPPATYNEGEELVLPGKDKLYRNSYAFDGWFDNPYFEGDELEKLPASLKEDITLYAKWVPNQTLSLANNYTPTLTLSTSNSNYSVTARMPDTCKSSTSEIYKYGFYIDDVCVTIQKSGNVSSSYNFTSYARSLTPGNHVIMVTVEIFDVRGSYSAAKEFTVQ